MDVAAFVALLLTVGGGLYLLSTWMSADARARGDSGIPAWLIFSHFGLASTALVMWFGHLLLGGVVLARIAFGLLLVVAAMGVTMFVRWVPSRRAHSRAETGQAAALERPGQVPHEARFPADAVLGHGVVAATTLVLVFLAAFVS